MNLDLFDCAENKLMSDDSGILSPLIFEKDILPTLQIPPHIDAVHLSFRTLAEGMFCITEPIELPSTFLHLPESFCTQIPRVCLLSLLKNPLHDNIGDPYGRSSYGGIQTVKRRDEADDTIYAIKDLGYNFISLVDMWPGLLEEVKTLCSLDSPYIMKPCYIVQNSKTSEFRGYLAPYFRRSTIAKALRDKEPARFSIRTILRWATQITSAMSHIHRMSIYCANFECDHILITDSDDICLISVKPHVGVQYLYKRAPEFDDTPLPVDPFTSSRDIWSLGIILWELWEQVPMNTEEQIRNCVWSTTGDVVPFWYKDLTERCLSILPEDRPTAAEVLRELEDKVPAYISGL